jgi:transposase
MAIQPPLFQLVSYLTKGQVTDVARKFGVSRQAVYRACDNPPRTDGKDKIGRKQKPREAQRRQIFEHCCDLIRSNYEEMRLAVEALPQK